MAALPAHPNVIGQVSTSKNKQSRHLSELRPLHANAIVQQAPAKEDAQHMSCRSSTVCLKRLCDGGCSIGRGSRAGTSSFRWTWQNTAAWGTCSDRCAHPHTKVLTVSMWQMSVGLTHRMLLLDVRASPDRRVSACRCRKKG